MTTGFKMGQNALGDFRDFTNSLQPLPQYAQQAYSYQPQAVNTSYAFDPYAQGGQAAQATNTLYSGLGIQQPTDTRAQSYAGLNQQLDKALTAAGATGARGGVAGSLNQPALEQFANAGAAIENNYANMLAAYDQNRVGQAMGLMGQAQQGAQFGAGQDLNAQLANQQAGMQNQQFGSQFDANQALQAYQLNNLLPRQEQIALQQALLSGRLGLAEAKMGRNAGLGSGALQAIGNIGSGIAGIF